MKSNPQNKHKAMNAQIGRRRVSKPVEISICDKRKKASKKKKLNITVSGMPPTGALHIHLPPTPPTTRGKIGEMFLSALIFVSVSIILTVLLVLLCSTILQNSAVGQLVKTAISI